MSISKEWLVGFIEGEGNFNVILSKHYKKIRTNYPFEYYPILQFRIFLREDDWEVLEKIKSFLTVGKIYKKDLTYNRNKGLNSRNQTVYYVTAKKDLLKLKEIFQSCEFHSKKKRDMEVFFRILDLKCSPKHLSKEIYGEIISLAQSMNSKTRSNFQVKRLAEQLSTSSEDLQP